MSRATALAFSVGLCSALISARAAANDWYVDIVNGNNANGGTAPNSAWRTLDWAMAHMPSGPQLIHVAPGTYSVLNGEGFPIAMKPQVAIVGDAGHATTILDANGIGFSLFTFSSDSLNGGGPFDHTSLFRGLTLTHAGIGVSANSSWGSVGHAFEDVLIEHMSTAALVYFAGAYPCCGNADVSADRLTIQNCARGIDTDGMAVTLTLTDCAILGCATDGIRALTGGMARIHMLRCRVEGSGGAALQPGVVNQGSSAFDAIDSLFIGNAGPAWNGNTTSPMGGSSGANFTRCTFAYNGVGVRALNATQQYNLLTLADSIVYDNGDDLDLSAIQGAVPVVTGCDIGDGDFAGQNGNFSADPRFRDAAGGDFRLSWRSPCIDVSTVALANGELDLAGHARNVDGDLNTTEIADLGCFEFLPFELIGNGQLGSQLTWELWGPQGNASTIYWTRTAMLGTVTNTPFGQLDLDPLWATVFRTTTVGAAAPTVLQRTIPNYAVLVGRTLAFQALTHNAAAPHHKAYTNAAQITIVP